MIRFCDKEVYCLRNDELKRGSLFSYFLDGHREDVLCVIDENGKYVGNITYFSLLRNDDVAGSIQIDKVVLNKDIWGNGRRFFEDYEKLGNEIVLLPVVDEEGQLLCFAYQDEDANREIRQLRELTECKEALGFSDIYPQYECVTIWECNELAYYFAEYLRRLGVPVRLRGNFWEKLNNFEGEGFESLDYRNMNIYAEGTWEKCENLREYMLRSVSVEFECIDVIYERNVKKGIIKDAIYGFENLIQNLKEKDLIVLTDIGRESLSACDFFKENGIEKICFLTKDNEVKRLVVGKPVYSLNQIRKNYENIALIDCYSEHSALISGELDYYDYSGYKRNESYFCLKDYIDLQHSSLEHLLWGKDIVMVGDVLYCKRFYSYYKQKMECKSIVYYNILDDKKAVKYCDQMPLEIKENLKITNIFLIFAPEYSYSNKKVREININQTTENTYIERLCQEGFYNYLIMKEEIPDDLINSDIKYSNCRFKPKMIIAGALLGDSGTALLRAMLGRYDKIVKLNYGLLNENLVSFCVKLSGEKSTDILKIFWELVEESVGKDCITLEFHDVNLFNKKMNEMLQIVERPTSQELFVIFHLAYAAMYDKDISNVNDYIIYWERHGVYRAIHPIHTKWLDAEDIKGLTIVNCRNCVVRAGGLLKYLKTMHYFERTDSLLFRTVMETPIEWDDEKSAWDKIEIKFEDLKCRPQKVMEKIGNKINVLFLNVLTDTNYKGQVDYGNMEQIMKPVYNTYEEFLSQFDKMRIALFTSEWQKKRGYPYMESMDITKKELQEMYLREFRFEKEIVFNSEEEYLMYRQGRQRWLWQKFSSLRAGILTQCC